jgi:hypothetical protein
LLDKNDDGKISYEEFRAWWVDAEVAWAEAGARARHGQTAQQEIVYILAAKHEQAT